MNRIALLPLLASFAAAPCSAKGHPPPHHHAGGGSQAKTWEQAEERIQNAVDDWEGASRECGNATRDYDDVAFSGGSQGDLGAKRDRLLSGKRSACNGKMGAETKILNACDEARKWVESSDDPEKASHLAYIAKVRAKHEAGHQLNPHKR